MFFNLSNKRFAKQLLCGASMGALSTVMIAGPALAQGMENVNIDHVAWYSYTTLTTLLKREGWIPEVHAWYKGEPYFSEGLIVVTEA